MRHHGAASGAYQDSVRLAFERGERLAAEIRGDLLVDDVDRARRCALPVLPRARGRLLERRVERLTQLLGDRDGVDEHLPRSRGHEVGHRAGHEVGA